jgi:hypothetical protein
MVDVWRETSVVGLLGVFVAVVTAGFAVASAIRPSERRLALIRPLSVATIFAGLCSFAIGLTNVFVGLSSVEGLTEPAWRAMTAGTAESLVMLVVTFGCLTLTWLCVAVALRRAA